MGAKAKPKKNDSEEKNVGEMNEMLSNKIQLVKWQIGNPYSVMEQEKADRARAGQHECRQKLVELDGQFEEEKKKAYTIT